MLVVGAGGLGSPAALYLAAAGCGTLGLLDYDRSSCRTCSARCCSIPTACRSAKASRRRASVSRAQSRTSASSRTQLELRAANVRELFAQYDLVLDGTDRLATRYVMNDACVMLGEPLVSAAIHRFEGQLLTYVPGQGPVLPVRVPARRARSGRPTAPPREC